MSDRPRALFTRLESLGVLADDDFDVLENILASRDEAQPGDLVVVEKQRITSVRVIEKGWGYRYQGLVDGSRQILNFLVPGDVFGFHATVAEHSECGIEALTPMVCRRIAPADLVDALTTRPRLLLALSWVATQSERILDQQITRIGRRDARTRMAHMLVELYVRLRRSGYDRAAAARLPIPQVVLADALALTPVHTSRTFRTLVRENLLAREDGAILLSDVSGLSRVAAFDRAYLDPDDLAPAARSILEPRQA